MQLEDNTIFITGGGSGIGRGLAEVLHGLGNQVIISGRRKAFLDEVTAANPGMASIELDITDPASILRGAARLIDEFPALNILINNAGIMPIENDTGAVDDAVTQAIITTNLLGPIRMTSALVEHLKSQPRATIVHNTSGLAYVPLASNPVYCASKAALHSYALTLRFQLRDTSVRVQEIVPPWVDTDLIFKSGDPRAMPLDAFIEETMRGLATDSEEVLVDALKTFRDNPGAGEHALVHGFNLAMVENPTPVGPQ